MIISIKDLNKADVLAALYNASRPLGMGFLHYDPQPMTRAEAEALLATDKYFDYLKGRVMKLDLASDADLNARLYDRDNGAGAAQTAIDALRAAGPQAIEIQAAHEVGKSAAADVVEKDLHQPTTFSNGVLTLGYDEVAEPLAEALRRARGDAL